MNPINEQDTSTYIGKPHMRGDEPQFGWMFSQVFAVNPTCVGMNRDHLTWSNFNRGKPHMRGDEPTGDTMDKQTAS